MNQESLDILAARKLRKKTSQPIRVSLLPSQVSVCGLPDAQGYVMRYIFPVAGTVFGPVVDVDGFDSKSPVEFHVDLGSGGSFSSRSFAIRKVPTFASFELDVGKGDKIAVRVVSRTEIGCVWVGFSFIPENPKVVSRRA